MNVNMAKKCIVKIMFILSIVFCGTGCGSEDNRPFVEYEKVDQILEEINSCICFAEVRACEKCVVFYFEVEYNKND
ncbi:MAG: hypothetical protein AB9856_02630 [Cellulosilyticaceae bacterium]